jgi:ComF family protein
MLEKFITLSARFGGQLVNWLCPSICVLCDQIANEGICLACSQDLPILPDCCVKCAKFLLIAASFSQNKKNPMVCGACLRNPPPIDRTFVLFPYEFPVIQLITQLKFQHRLYQAKLLGQLLLQQIQQHWYKNQALPDLIIPVPLHPQRLRERGFNQALEIAKPIGRALHIPIDLHGLRRIKSTSAQSGLSAVARKDNIAGAFYSEFDYAGRHVALLDDVVTTGHTVAECCKILRRQEAAHIDVWCCARRG